MPETFAFPIREALWIPLSIDPLATPRGAGSELPGDRAAEARRQRRAGEGAGRRRSRRSSQRDFPATNRGVGADVMPYAKTVLGPEIYALLYTMLGAGIGVLLIACVNVSNLLVARASLRRREVAVRMALGAGASRVVRQHLTEVLVLATAGGGTRHPAQHRRHALVHAGAVGQSAAVLDHLRAGLPRDALRPRPDRAGQPVRRRAAGAARVARRAPAPRSRTTAASSTSARLGRFSSGLVVAELAVSCGLLIAAGPDDQERRPAEERADAVRDRERPDGARRPAARRPIRTPPASIRFFEQLLPKLQALPGDRGGHAVGRPAGGRQRRRSRCRFDGHAYPQTQRLSARARGHRDRRILRHVPDAAAVAGASSLPSDVADEPAGGDHQRVVRADALSEPRSDGPADEAHPARVEGAVADHRRRGAGSADGRHRQQQREPGRLLHSDRAERRRQRRAHRGAHARRPGRRRRRSVRAAVASLDADLAHLRGRHDAVGHRPADAVLHGLRHLLHGVRLLRAVPRRRPGSTA